MNDDDDSALASRLIALQEEHRDLDEAIAALAEQSPFDQLKLQRLKKRKLMLKDAISQLQAHLHPDIIA